MKNILAVLVLLIAGATAWSAEKYDGVHFEYNNTQTTVDLRLHTNGDVATLEAENLDHFLYMLGYVRMGLKPPVGETPSHMIKYLSPWEISTWSPQTDRQTEVGYPDKAVLLIRHPGFGWLRLSFSKDEAREIGEYLVEQSKKN